MKQIELTKVKITGPCIMIFTEGTILRPKSWYSTLNHNSYLPAGDCVQIIHEWTQQGAEVIYITSRKGQQAENIAKLLKKHHFSGTGLVYRSKGEQYKDLVEAIRPDVMIEDDCKSIGGVWQRCITKVKPEIKKNIKSIVVKEFSGINDLPRKIDELFKYE